MRTLKSHVPTQNRAPFSKHGPCGSQAQQAGRHLGPTDYLSRQTPLQKSLLFWRGWLQTPHVLLLRLKDALLHELKLSPNTIGRPSPTEVPTHSCACRKML